MMPRVCRKSPVMNNRDIKNLLLHCDMNIRKKKENRLE